MKNRSAATLTEVLMALLIMSIGIVSVITMFPLAVLRSIQATNLTNSRLLKENVEQVVRTQHYRPGTPTDPAFHFDLTNQSTIRHTVSVPAVSRIQFRGEWEPRTVYYNGEIVVPTRKGGNTAPTPNLWFVCLTPEPLGEMSGEIEPSWQISTPISDGTLIASAVAPQEGWLANVQQPLFPGHPLSARPFQAIALGGVVYDALNYVVDPLGWQMFNGDLSLNGVVTSANDFGYFSANGIGGAVAPTNYATPQLQLVNHRLLRVNGGLAALASSATEALAIAEGIGMNGDTWKVELTSTVDSVAPVPIPPSAPWLTANRSAVFPPTVDLSAIQQATAADPGSVRIVLKNLAGSLTVARTLESIDPLPAVDLTTNTVRWREPIPDDLVADGLARIERLDRRYSWLATVNKTPQGSANVTVAVFGKRSFTPDDEHVYATDFTTGLADQATISWSTAEPTPLLREGNYVLDGYTARWHRIVAVSGKDSPVTVTFDKTVPANHRVSAGRLIVMRGIIEIFEL